MSRILVLGSNNNAALAITQDLGEDYKVYCFGFKEDFNKVKYSKFLAGSREVSKHLGLNQLKSHIADYINQYHISFLIPTNDRFALLAGEADFRRSIPGVLITTPGDEQLKRGMHKPHMAEIASKHGFFVPKIFKKGEVPVFPLFLKSNYSWEIKGQEFIRGSVLKIENQLELKERLENIQRQKTISFRKKFTVRAGGWKYCH